MPATKPSDFPAVTTPAGTDIIPTIQSGVDKRYSLAQLGLAVRVPVSHTMFHGGATGIYTTPTAASNIEVPTVPMSRILTDLNNVTQARLVIGVRAVGAGYTTAVFRPRYATNNLTQSAWADLAATSNAGDLSIVGGTASAIRATSWFNIAAGAIGSDEVIRLDFVSTGTGTTAATISFVDLLLR